MKHQHNFPCLQAVKIGYLLSKLKFLLFKKLRSVLVAAALCVTIGLVYRIRNGRLVVTDFRLFSERVRIFATSVTATKFCKNTKTESSDLVTKWLNVLYIGRELRNVVITATKIARFLV